MPSFALATRNVAGEDLALTNAWVVAAHGSSPDAAVPLLGAA
jgi:hypothetical protein